MREFIAAVTAAFPDGLATIDDLIAEGDRLMLRVTSRGTHQGEFLGVPATGRTVSAWVTVMSRMAGARSPRSGSWSMVSA